MTRWLVTPEDGTPLDLDETAGLIPALRSQADLNAFEGENIAACMAWAAQSRKLRKGFPSPDLLRELHRRMFDQTWRWAGTYRTRDTNIGQPWPQITVAVRDLCDDIRYQLDHGTGDPDHLSAMFHHRLVSIHPFPNGNGRHARLACDVLRRNLGVPAWSWGASTLGVPGTARTAYLAALRAADNGDLESLKAFAT